MLRIARCKKKQFSTVGLETEQLLLEHERLIALIGKFISASATSVLAKPLIVGDEIEWYSELSGQPVCLPGLPETEQKQVKKLLFDRLTALGKLAKELPNLDPGAVELQNILQQAIQYPNENCIYAVNGQPVIIFWGHCDKKTAKRGIKNASTKPRRLSGVVSFLGWLAILALLGSLLWYWLSNNAVYWQDYNPFIDEYQQLVDEIRMAGDVCEDLQKNYTNNESLHRPDEKFIALKKQLQKRLTRCEGYENLVNAIQMAKDNCTELEKILANNIYLQQPEGKFIALKQTLQNKIDKCLDYQKLLAAIKSAADDCVTLQKIYNTNERLQKPEGKFITLKQKLEIEINDCFDYNQLHDDIKSEADDCDALKNIYEESGRLQEPKGKFISLKQDLENKINDCSDYQSLETALQVAKNDCNALKKIYKQSKYLQKPEKNFITLKKKYDEQSMVCKRKEIERQAKLCPGERPVALAPELVIVMDASGSMAKPISGKAMMDALTRMMLGQRIDQRGSRMFAAKQAVTSLVQKTPSDMKIGLVVVKRCSTAKSYGFYSPNKRRKLLGVVDKLRPSGGTPLGSGLLKAGQMIDGVSKPSTIVVISDGKESCQANPCAVARKLAAKKPLLTISVVDIMGTGAGNCLARATKKGKVYTAVNRKDIIRMTEKAASTVALPKHCK